MKSNWKARGGKPKMWYHDNGPVCSPDANLVENV